MKTKEILFGFLKYNTQQTHIHIYSMDKWIYVIKNNKYILKFIQMEENHISYHILYIKVVPNKNAFSAVAASICQFVRE